MNECITTKLLVFASFLMGLNACVIDSTKTVDESKSTIATQENSIQIPPISDGYVRNGTYANTNYGDKSPLEAITTSTLNNNRVVYFKFDLTSVSNISSAMLKILIKYNSAENANLGVYAVADTTWKEKKLTWNNQPILGALLASGAITGTNYKNVSFDISEYIIAQRNLGKKFLSLGLQGTANSSSYFTVLSREESSNKPLLQLEYASGSNSAPSIKYEAFSDPSVVPSVSSTLSILGDDNAGETNLIYTWANTSNPGVPATFSVNGNNAAKNTVATYNKAGTYSFAVTIKDAGGLSVTSKTLHVSVQQSLTSVVINQINKTVMAGQGLQYTLRDIDQFGNTFIDSTKVTWTASGGGTISEIGALSAGSIPGGPYTISANKNGKTHSTNLTISASTNQAPVVAQTATATNTGDPKIVNLRVLGSDPDGSESSLSYEWLVINKPSGAGELSYSYNNSNTSKSTSATFFSDGSYTLQVTIRDVGGLYVTSLVDVYIGTQPQ